MTCVRTLNGDITEDPTIRCPGWNNELRTRLGGCGKPIEHWTDTNGRQHNRSDAAVHVVSQSRRTSQPTRRPRSSMNWLAAAAPVSHDD
jgi:hypothetical protein